MSLLLIVAAILQDRYVVDAGESRFTAKVEVGGLLSMFGHDHLVALREFTGDLPWMHIDNGSTAYLDRPGDG